MGILFQEDFSTDLSAWWLQRQDSGSYAIDNGRIHFQVSADDTRQQINLVTNQQFSGNFDLACDYEIATATGTADEAGAVVLMIRHVPDSYGPYISVRSDGAGGLHYVVGAPGTTVTVASVQAQQIGKLRLERRYGWIIAYYWNSDLQRWEWNGDPRGFRFQDTVFDSWAICIGSSAASYGSTDSYIDNVVCQTIANEGVYGSRFVTSEFILEIVEERDVSSLASPFRYVPFVLYDLDGTTLRWIGQFGQFVTSATHRINNDLSRKWYFYTNNQEQTVCECEYIPKQDDFVSTTSGIVKARARLILVDDSTLYLQLHILTDGTTEIQLDDSDGNCFAAGGYINLTNNANFAILYEEDGQEVQETVFVTYAPFYKTKYVVTTCDQCNVLVTTWPLLDAAHYRIQQERTLRASLYNDSVVHKKSIISNGFIVFDNKLKTGGATYPTVADRIAKVESLQPPFIDESVIMTTSTKAIGDWPCRDQINHTGQYYYFVTGVTDPASENLSLVFMYSQTDEYTNDVWFFDATGISNYGADYLDLIHKLHVTLPVIDDNKFFYTYGTYSNIVGHGSYFAQCTGLNPANYSVKDQFFPAEMYAYEIGAVCHETNWEADFVFRDGSGSTKETTFRRQDVYGSKTVADTVMFSPSIDLSAIQLASAGRYVWVVATSWDFSLRSLVYDYATVVNNMPFSGMDFVVDGATQHVDHGMFRVVAQNHREYVGGITNTDYTANALLLWRDKDSPNILRLCILDPANPSGFQHTVVTTDLISGTGGFTSSAFRDHPEALDKQIYCIWYLDSSNNLIYREYTITLGDSPVYSLGPEQIVKTNLPLMHNNLTAPSQIYHYPTVVYQLTNGDVVLYRKPFIGRSHAFSKFGYPFGEASLAFSGAISYGNYLLCTALSRTMLYGRIFNTATNEWVTPFTKMDDQFLDTHQARFLAFSPDGYVWLAHSGRDTLGIPLTVLKSPKTIDDPLFEFNLSKWSKVSVDYSMAYGRGYKFIITDKTNTPYLFVVDDDSIEVSRFDGSGFPFPLVLTNNDTVNGSSGTWAKWTEQYAGPYLDANNDVEAFALFWFSRAAVGTDSWGSDARRTYNISFAKLVPQVDGSIKAYNSSGQDVFGATGGGEMTLPMQHLGENQDVIYRCASAPCYNYSARANGTAYVVGDYMHTQGHCYQCVVEGVSADTEPTEYANPLHHQRIVDGTAEFIEIGWYGDLIPHGYQSIGFLIDNLHPAVLVKLWKDETFTSYTLKLYVYDAGRWNERSLPAGDQQYYVLVSLTGDVYFTAVAAFAHNDSAILSNMPVVYKSSDYCVTWEGPIRLVDVVENMPSFSSRFIYPPMQRFSNVPFLVAFSYDMFSGYHRDASLLFVQIQQAFSRYRNTYRCQNRALNKGVW